MNLSPLLHTKAPLRCTGYCFDEPVIELKKAVVKEKEELIPAKEQEQFIKQLDDLMVNQHHFRAQALTLRCLSMDMGINANKLSLLLNEVVGKRFNDYINELRISDFKNKAVERS